MRPNSHQPCIEVCPQPTWDVFMSKISVIAETDTRGLAWKQRELAKAVTVGLDPDGALDIPEPMAAHAELSSGASVVTVGFLDRLTVWHKQRWMDFQNGEEQDATYVMEKYGQELFWPINS